MQLPGALWRVTLLIKEVPMQQQGQVGMYLVGIEADRAVPKDTMVLVLKLAQKMLEEQEWRNLPESGPTQSA